MRFSRLFKRLPFFFYTRRRVASDAAPAFATNPDGKDNVEFALRRTAAGDERGDRARMEGESVTKDREARSSDSRRGAGVRMPLRESLRDTGAYEKSDSCNDEGLLVAETRAVLASIPRAQTLFKHSTFN